MRTFYIVDEDGKMIDAFEGYCQGALSRATVHVGKMPNGTVLRVVDEDGAEYGVAEKVKPISRKAMPKPHFSEPIE